MRKALLCVVILTASNCMYASSLNGCSYPGLSNGVSLSLYKKCRSAIDACPKINNMYVDKACLKKVNATAVCKQMDKVAASLQVSTDMLTITSVGRFKIVDISFIADGAHTYYIATPHGCFINTTVDPRALDAKLKAQYANQDFFSESAAPKYNGSGHFTADITVKKQCRACDVIGTAKVDFHFSGTGKYLKTSLVKFTAK